MKSVKRPIAAEHAIKGPKTSGEDIKAFYGTSENAVNTQIWIAVSVYVLMAIVRKRMQIAESLYTILQVLSLTLFEKMPLYQAFAQGSYKTEITSSHNQLKLFAS